MSQGVFQNNRDRMAHRLYKATKRTDLVPPMTYTNATTEGLYTGNNMQSPRAEADNNLQHYSLKLGAQIQLRG